ncbi:MAG: FliA/WhiG family RNA polymerase sigma factor [Candidatus Limnocylindrales bacterium]
MGLDQSVDQRIIAHLGFARAVATRAVDPRCHGADREDLVAWGILGLVQAAQRYAPESGATFGAYAARRVRGQVLDALRERDPLTRSARKAFRQARERDPELPAPVVEISLDAYLETGRDPTGSAAFAGHVTQCRAARDRRWAHVADAVDALPVIERTVLVLSYARGLTLREIGARIGLSESGVCRLRGRALRHVRARCVQSEGPTLPGG